MAAITTVITTYRRPQLLARAIRSVLAQEYQDFQIHIYDDASGDETEEVVNEFTARDPRVKYHRHPCNIGIMQNFEFAIAHVETPLFNIISDDDFVLRGFFQRAVRALEQYRDTAFFLGGLIYAGTDGEVVHSSVSNWQQTGLVGRRDLFLSLLPGTWMTWTSTLFRTECVHRAGGLDLKTGYTGDVDLMLRLAAAHSAFVDPEPCGVMTVHSGSASTDGAAVLRQHLSLHGYTNLIHAVRGALSTGSLTPVDAERMERKITRETVWGLFRRAMIFGAGGEIKLARETADVLRSAFGRGDLATMLGLFAGDGLGRSARPMLRHLRLLRQRLRRIGNADPSSALVLDTLSAIDSPQSWAEIHLSER